MANLFDLNVIEQVNLHKLKISRIGTYYYVIIYLLSLMYMIRLFSSRAYFYVNEKTGRKVSKRKLDMIMDKRLHAILFLAFSYIICTIGYFNIDVLHLNSYEVNINKKASEDELNICLISDIHAGSGTWEYTYDELLDLINECNSDVLLIAGDVFDETTSESDIEQLAWVFETMDKPKYGMYYVYGNHDNKNDDWAAKKMEEMGVTVLQDEMITISDDIQLIGLLDPKLKAEDPETLFPKLNLDYDYPIIVLQHRPKHYQMLSELGADLVMAGHTHGFNIPFYLTLPLLSDSYYGLKKYNEMSAITSSGVSAWGFHYKFPAESEVVNIHVTFNSDSQK